MPHAFIVTLLLGLLFSSIACAESDPAPATASRATRSTGAVLSYVPADQRQHPGLEPPGIRLGELLLHPSARVMAIFDSNVYATPTNRKSDLVTVVSPGISAKSLHPNHGINFSANSHHGFYADNNGENYNDYQVEASPYMRMTKISTLKARLLWQRAHELRTSDAANTNFGAEEPVRYTQALGRLFWQYRPGRFGLTPHLQHADISYENVARRGGGASFVNNDRDRAEDEAGIELSYDFWGKNQLYWRNRVFRRDYKRGDYNSATLSYGVQRDSDGFESRIGTNYFLTPITRLDINGGYYSQNFDANGFKDISTAVGQATLTWPVTALTTCYADLERRVWETAQDNASGFVQDRAGFRVAHELRRHLVLGLQTGVGRNDYTGNIRKDEYWEGGVSALYKMSGNLGWKVDYIYEERDSNVLNADYSKHQVFVGLQVQF